MKKAALTICLLFTVSMMYAQGFSYGIKGGWNYSTVRHATLDANFQQGFHAGVYAKLSAIIIAVQPELLFSQRGYTSNERNVKLNYIDIPVLAKLTVFPGVSVDAGPQYSVLLGKSVSGSANGIPDPDFRSGELGGVAGLSVQVWRLGASARYCFGFQDIEANTRSKNSMFQLSLSVKL